MLRTPVYIKMDAHDQLLLAEGVCSQLGVVEYHKDVWPGRKLDMGTEKAQQGLQIKDAPVVSVKQVCVSQEMTIPARKAVTISVAIEGGGPQTGPLLLEGCCDNLDGAGLEIERSLFQPNEKGQAMLTILNTSGFTEKIPRGTVIGKAMDVQLIYQQTKTEGDDRDTIFTGAIKQVNCNQDIDTARIQWRKKTLLDILGKFDLPSEENAQMGKVLSDHHDVFALEDKERGETDLVQLEIETGSSPPARQHPRRMPFAAREEVARQLEKMQEMAVIQPSRSPWSSPVVLVRKKDGSHRFCVDYRKLNSVTKADTYPLPRIDDLLDQLGKSTYFSTLDLASGFWQIKMHPESQEKTAFSTPHGLFEFRVMPFGLMNAPSVFQRLMQQVLSSINPENGPQFVTPYMDDLLVFSSTLVEHLDHLKLILMKLRDVGLKLNPNKCCFIRQEVEYLGHVITPHGLKPNDKLIAAVREFVPPKNAQEL